MTTLARRGTGSRRSSRVGRGLFLTFEGIEGSGKTSQCQALANTLRLMGYRVLETREPGGTRLAERTRDLLLAPPSKDSRGEIWTPAGEAALIFACRSQHITHMIRPALDSGTIVLCDRYADSTLAYQGYGRGLSIQELTRFQRFISRGLTPDKTFFFDLPVQVGLARRRQAKDLNRLDLETFAFHERVRKGFRRLAKDHPRRIITLNAHLPVDTLAEQVQAIVTPLLKSVARPAKRYSRGRQATASH